MSDGSDGEITLPLATDAPAAGLSPIVGGLQATQVSMIWSFVVTGSCAPCLSGRGQVSRKPSPVRIIASILENTMGVG